MKIFEKIWHNQQGFTLLEMVISLGVLSIVALVIGEISRLGTASYVDTYYDSVLMSEGRSAMKVLRRDFQMLSPEKIRVLGQAHLRFVDLNGKTIDYRFYDGTLFRNRKPLCRNLLHSPIRYLTKNLNEVHKMDDLSFLHIKLLLVKGKYKNELEELVYVRN